MGDNPMIIFCGVALELVLMAKQGRPGIRDRLRLARAALVFSEHNSDCTAEVEHFLATVQDQPLKSADQLEGYIQRLLSSVSPAPVFPPEYDWQKRADLQ